MRWTRWIAAAACGLGMIAATLTLLGATPAAKPTKAAAKAPAASKADQAKKIERGEYLVTVMGCGDCHTPGTLYGAPDHERMLSGSELGWRGPWGLTYSRNLTPDLETGIGYWSEDEIVNAIRAGMSADRGVLQPPMPWRDFARLTDEDAYAIAAYLKSLKPIKHAVPDRLGPDQAKSATGSIIDFPAPSAWDVPPPAGGADKK